jgi:hypothetical protein
MTVAWGVGVVVGNSLTNGDGVAVTTGIGVGVATGVFVGVADDVGESLTVGIGFPTLIETVVLSGVAVFVGVEVDVGVAAAVSVGDTVGVLVGVGVLVAALVGVTVRVAIAHGLEYAVAETESPLKVHVTRVKNWTASRFFPAAMESGPNRSASNDPLFLNCEPCPQSLPSETHPIPPLNLLFEPIATCSSPPSNPKYAR